jgi:hypothetical protein
MKLSSKRTPKVSKSLYAKGQGAYRWDLGEVAFEKREEARGHNGTKMGKKCG